MPEIKVILDLYKDYCQSSSLKLTISLFPNKRTGGAVPLPEQSCLEVRARLQQTEDNQAVEWLQTTNLPVAEGQPKRYRKTREQQIEQGAPVDVFLPASSKFMDTIGSNGLIKTETRKNLLVNEVVLIAPEGSSETRSKDMEISAPANDIPLARNAYPVPTFPIIKLATAGPIIRSALKTVELSATTFERCPSLTSAPTDLREARAVFEAPSNLKDRSCREMADDRCLQLCISQMRT